MGTRCFSILKYTSKQFIPCQQLRNDKFWVWHSGRKWAICGFEFNAGLAVWWQHWDCPVLTCGTSVQEVISLHVPRRSGGSSVLQPGTCRSGVDGWLEGVLFQVQPRYDKSVLPSPPSLATGSPGSCTHQSSTSLISFYPLNITYLFSFYILKSILPYSSVQFFHQKSAFPYSFKNIPLFS